MVVNRAPVGPDVCSPPISYSPFMDSFSFKKCFTSLSQVRSKNQECSIWVQSAKKWSFLCLVQLEELSKCSHPVQFKMDNVFFFQRIAQLVCLGNTFICQYSSTATSIKCLGTSQSCQVARVTLAALNRRFLHPLMLFGHFLCYVSLRAKWYFWKKKWHGCGAPRTLLNLTCGMGRKESGVIL